MRFFRKALVLLAVLVLPSAVLAGEAPLGLQKGFVGNLCVYGKAMAVKERPETAVVLQQALLEEEGWETVRSPGILDAVEGRFRARLVKDGVTIVLEAGESPGGAVLGISYLFEMDERPGLGNLSENLFPCAYGRCEVFLDKQTAGGREIVQVVECPDPPSALYPLLGRNLAREGWAEPALLTRMRHWGRTTADFRIWVKGGGRVLVTASPRKDGWTYCLLKADVKNSRDRNGR